MWQFAISDGALYHDDQPMGYGYSGHDEGKNNPAMVEVKCVGPLPPGLYTIGPARDHPHLGPCAMPLTPDPANVMYGRAGFWIHADAWQHPGEASEGCIVLANIKREAISQSDDTSLHVVVDFTPTTPTPPEATP